ncbi:MAG: hypothetical protein U0X91_07100 [Spirosomataceae bacterium]
MNRFLLILRKKMTENAIKYSKIQFLTGNSNLTDSALNHSGKSPIHPSVSMFNNRPVFVKRTIKKVSTLLIGGLLLAGRISGGLV